MEQKSKDGNKKVWIHDKYKKIIYYKEPYSTTKEQLNENFQLINDLAKSFGKFYLIVDLTEASRPKAEIRQHILKKFDLIKKNVGHVAIFTEKNLLLNMAATFVLRKTGLSSFTVNQKLKEAEEAIEKFKG